MVAAAEAGGTVGVVVAVGTVMGAVLVAAVGVDDADDGGVVGAVDAAAWTMTVRVEVAVLPQVSVVT